MTIKAVCLTCDWGVTVSDLIAFSKEILLHAEECSNSEIIVKIVPRTEEENETSNS